uniref:Uncharacterized protein n=1 Tax=Oryza punctata TaxID=4537 RepID=A0A0E0K8L1_ORYPU
MDRRSGSGGVVDAGGVGGGYGGGGLGGYGGGDAGASATGEGPEAGRKREMVVLRVLVTVGRLPHCRSAPSRFLEFLPFFVGLRRQLAADATPLSLGSPLAKSGEEASGWRDGGDLNQFPGMVAGFSSKCVSQLTEGCRYGGVEASC